jgi:hypothetical protein
MCDINYVFYAWSPDVVRVTPISAVEVTRTDDGVLLHAGPGVPGIRISLSGWGDFVTAVRAGEFDATLDDDYSFRTGDIRPLATDAVEVARTRDGVFLHVLPGTGVVHIPRREWRDFIGGIYGRTFDDTLPSADDFVVLDAE